MFARKTLCFISALLLVVSASMPALAEVIQIQLGEYPTLVAVGQVFSVAIDGLDYSGYQGNGTITLTDTGLTGTLQRTGSTDEPYGQALFDGLSYDLSAVLGNHFITVEAVHHGNLGIIRIPQPIRVAAPDSAPTPRIDFRGAKLTSLVAGRTYGVTVGGAYQGAQTADASGAIAIPPAWMTGGQGSFSIMQRGDGHTYVDSDKKTLTLPARPAAPSPAPVGVSESSAGQSDGKITGVSTAMEWSGDNGVTWTPCTGTSVTGLAPGSYLVRIAPVQTSDLVGSFASPSVSVTIDPASPSSGCQITGFQLAGVSGVIDQTARTVTVTLPHGTDVRSLAPQITHTGASISPASGAAQDFTHPRTYTVTAQDDSAQVYTVIVTVRPAPAPVPKTGDNFPLGGLLALMGAMLAAMGWLGTRLRGGKSAA